MAKRKTPQFIDIIRVKKPKKTLTLHVVSKKIHIIVAPLGVSEEQILEILEKNKAYDFTEKPIFREKIKPRFENKARFWYLGHQYPIIFSPNEKKIHLTSHKLFIPSKGLSLKERKNLLQKWYKNEARKYIVNRANFLAAQYGFSFSSLGITSAQKRWASCSAKNRLSFSWRLIQAPEWVIDYVILHELTHTKIKNHSRKFWQEVAKVYPDYKIATHWLKAHALELLTW